jgi:hypothetical protein
MDARKVRGLAIVGSALLLAFGVFEFFAAQASFGLVALVLMSSLAALGTLLGRVPQAHGFVSSAGVVGGVAAVSLLVGRRDPAELVLSVAVLAVCLGLILAALRLRRATASPESDPPAA